MGLLKCDSFDLKWKVPFSPCLALLIQDGAHALLFVLGTVRLMSICCQSYRPRPLKMHTTGQLLQLLKSVIALILALTPVLIFLGESFSDFTHFWKDISKQPGLVYIDLLVRTFSWLYCFLLLVLAQHHRLSESYLLCVWWFLVLVGSVPMLLSKSDKYVSHQFPRGDVYFSFLLYVIINICMIFQHRFVYTGRTPLSRAVDTGPADFASTRLPRRNRTSGGPSFEESRRGTQLWEDRWIDFEKILDGDDSQFKDLRYTAVSLVDPQHFDSEGYKLRCNFNEENIKLLIGVTLEGQSPEDFNKTLIGICQNVKQMTEKEGENIWKEVLLCVIVDGKDAQDKNTLSFAASLGIFDPALMAKKGPSVAKASARSGDNGDEEEKEEDGAEDDDASVTHMFEYSAQITEDESFNRFFPPLQVVFTLKEQKLGRMDSHLWFFDAFAAQLRPEYCLLMHAGVKPAPRAIYKLYRALEINADYGAVCGETLTPGNVGEDWIVSSQKFDLKVSQILDKALEAVCGYVTLMPSHFVAYRYRAIARRGDGSGPLEAYFRGVRTPLREADVKAGRIPHPALYHAPQQVLCFEAMMQPGRRWEVQYVKNAKCRVEVPSEIAEVVARKAAARNAHAYSLLYNLRAFGRFWEGPTHSLTRKLSVAAVHAFRLLQLGAEWFAIALFFLAFSRLVDQMATPCESYTGDTVHKCWKVTNFGTANNVSYRRDDTNDGDVYGYAVPQCFPVVRGYQSEGYDCGRFDLAQLTCHRHLIVLPGDPDPELPCPTTQNTTHELDLVFQNTTQVLTLWSGVSDCYNPLNAADSPEQQKANRARFEEDDGFNSCCLPAQVESCGVGRVYNSSGSYEVNYPCLTTGCGVGVDPVTIMRLMFASVYMLVLMTSIVIGLGNKTVDVIYETTIVSYFYGAAFYMMAIIYLNYLINDVDENCFGIPPAWISTGTLVLFSFYWVGALFHGEAQNLLSTWPHYFFLWPSLVNLVHIVAFSRLDEIPSHNILPAAAPYAKASARAAPGEHAKALKEFDKRRTVDRSKVLLLWLFTNAMLILGATFLPKPDDSVFALIWLLAAALMSVRVLGSVGYVYMLQVQPVASADAARAKRELAEAEEAKRFGTVEVKRRKFEFKSLDMYLDDVTSDELTRNPAFDAPVAAARAALDAVHDGTRIRAHEADAAPRDLEHAFDRLVDRSRQLTHEIQLLSIERRKLNDLTARLRDIVEEEDLIELPVMRKKLKHCQNALANAAQTQWADLGDVKKLRLRVSKADNKLEELRHVELDRRRNDVKKAERELDQHSADRVLLEAAGGEEEVTKAKQAIDASRKAIDDVVGVYRRFAETVRQQIADVERAADRARADRRKRERQRWLGVSELLQRLAEPAAAPECLDDDQLDKAVHKAHERVGDLQAAISMATTDEFDKAEQEAKTAVDEARKRLKKTRGK